MSNLLQNVLPVNPSSNDVSLVGWGSRNPDADLLDKAFAWGHEDATEGADMQGSVYFVGEALENYNEGYAAGLEVRQQLEGPSDELAFMAGVLESLRRGTTPAECALADQWLY